MIIVILLLAVMVVAMAAYLYFFVNRGMTAFDVAPKTKTVRILLLLGCLCLGGLCLLRGGFGLVVLLYVMMVAGIIGMINRFLKQVAKEQYQTGYGFWKRWFVSGVVPVVIVALILGMGYGQLRRVVPTHYTVTTQKSVAPMRVVLVADAHFGVSIDQNTLADICDEITATKPDLVVLCGDMVDNATTKEEMEQVFTTFGTVQSTYGTYFVYGNHDRPMRLVESEFSLQELNRVIERAGITVLQDERVPIREDFVLVGREDRSVMGRNAKTTRKDLVELLKGIDREDYILTLDHQPNEFEQNGTAGTDLLLSGHTHAGQIFPINWLQEIVPFNDGVYGQ